MVKYINGHPPGIIFIPGDLCKHFPLSHRHRSIEDFEESEWPTPVSQINEAERIIESIDYLPEYTTIGKGNHEKTIFRQAGNLFKDPKSGRGLCQRLGVHYAGFEAYYHLSWPDGTDIDILSTHGTGTNPHLRRLQPGMGWRKSANAAIYLRDQLASIDGGASDLYLKAHEHRAYYYKPKEYTQMVNTGDGLEPRKMYENFIHKPVWAACSGSLGKTRVAGYTTYQEERQYGLADIAMLHIQFEKEDGRRIPKINIVDLT